MRTKTMLIGLIAFLAGLAVFAAGYFASGRDLSAVNGRLGPIAVYLGGNRRGVGFSGDRTGGDAGTYTRRETFDPADFHQIRLREDNAAVTVGPSPDGLIHVTWQEEEDRKLQFTVEDQTLRMEREGRFGILFFGFWEEDHTTELLLPENMLCRLEVETANGDLTAAGLSLDRAGGVTLKSDNGEITAKEMVCGTLTVSGGNGAVIAEDVECPLNVTLSDGNGRVEAERVAAASFHADTSNGRIDLTDVSAAETLFAQSGNDRITVKNIAAGSAIDLRSSNGDIRGTVANADYRYETHTANGDNNLPQDWGQGAVLLKVRTDNGDINIGFEPD